MARATGLEPAASGVTGRRSNQLSYARKIRKACRPDRLAGALSRAWEYGFAPAKSREGNEPSVSLATRSSTPPATRTSPGNWFLRDESGERFDLLGPGKDGLSQERGGHIELLRQQALEDGAQIDCRLEIASLVQVAILEPWPIGNDAPALDRPAGEERNGAGAMIGSDRAVDARGAAELRNGDDRRILPARAKIALKGLEGRVEPAEKLRQLPVGPPSLACVSQPSNDSAATRGPSSAAINLAAPSAVSCMPTTALRVCAPAGPATPSREAMRSVSSPCASAAWSAGSRCAYRSMMRPARSSGATSASRGAQPSTGTLPRKMRGVVGPTARPRASIRSPLGKAPMARFSQPDSMCPGPACPLSKTSWPSKWDRSR